jgi:hypothetical protein
MLHDLRTTISPVYPDLLDRLLSLLPRSISSPALTALLETLSSLFRYLLIPDIDPKLMDQTWSKICTVLPKCLGEVQRAVAEVWAGVLRRMKAGPREKAARLLAENAGILEDASAWVVVFACKVYFLSIYHGFVELNFSFDSLYLKPCTHVLRLYLCP